MSLADIAWQPSLLSDQEPGRRCRFHRSGARELDGGAWVDHCPGWLRGAGLGLRHSWSMRSGGATTGSCGERVVEPRLRASYDARGACRGAGRGGPPSVRAYDVDFDSVGLNLYRDGRDSVAWHGDRIPRDLPEPLVATLSLGAQRRFCCVPRAVDGRCASSRHPVTSSSWAGPRNGPGSTRSRRWRPQVLGSA